MELIFHLPEETDDIIRVEADGHAAPVKRVDHHEKGVDLVVHGVIVEILYDADNMIGDRPHQIIVIVEDEIERVFYAKCYYGGFIEEDGGGVGRKLSEIEIAAFDHLHAEGRNIMIVDPERSHKGRLLGVKQGIRKPAFLPVLAAADGREVGGDSCVGNPGKGEQVIAKIGCTIPAERPGTMDDEYLIPVEADLLISDIVQLAVDNEGAYDKPNGNKKLKDHQAAAEPAAPETCSYLSFQHIDRLKGGKVESRVAAGETADQQHQEDENGQEPAAEKYIGMK